MKSNGNNKDSMDELNKIIDKYTEGNYLFSKTAKEEMAKDIFALFSVNEKEYNETMHEVWDFLEANETE